MIKPTIHNNGSDPEELLNSYIEASDAICVAIDKLEKCTPHSRDYYIQSTAAMDGAMKEHIARVQRLIIVRAEFQVLAESVRTQMDERAEQHRLYRESMK